MIHIVFNTADIAALEAAIALDGSLTGKIIEIIFLIGCQSP